MIPSLTSRFPELDNELFIKTFLLSPWLGDELGDTDTKAYTRTMTVGSLSMSFGGDEADEVLNEGDNAYLTTAGKGVSAALSAGYVAWILRAGSLLTGVASSLPAWRGFDPLPVLDANANASTKGEKTTPSNDPLAPFSSHSDAQDA